MKDTGYRHTQKGRLHLYLYVAVLILLVPAWQQRDAPWLMLLLLAVALLLLLCALSFSSMTVQDEGQQLAIRYGPLRFFHKCIPYSTITAVEPGQTSFIDGLGIHYVPGRGWTYNLWGTTCAVVHQGKTKIRVGSDDVENLIGFLRGKLANKDQ